MADEELGARGAALGSFLGRGKRLSGHLFWHVLGVILSVGLPQLVLFPTCLHLMGPDDFGKFSFAIGIVSIVGLTPTRGLNLTLLRNLAGISAERRPLLHRTAFVLTLLVISGIWVLATLAGLAVWLRGAADPEIVVWILVLGLAFAAQNIAAVSTIDFAFTRQFARRTVWQNLGGVLCFLALPGLFLIGVGGVPIGYTLGHIGGLLALLVARRRVFLNTPRFDKKMARPLGSMWLVLSISAFCFMSGRYVHRTILGASVDYEAVSAFFAAAATLDLFMMPIATLGLFGIAILAAHASRRSLPPRLLKWYALAAVVGAACFYGVIVWLAPWPLRLLYGAVADAARPTMSIMALGVAVSVLMHAARPFVQRFSSRRTILALGGVVLVAHLGSALVLIPLYDLKGAAWSYCIGMGVAGLSWFTVFVSSLIRPPADGLEPTSIDNLDP